MRPPLRMPKPNLAPVNPAKAVMAAPRLKPVSTRDYGKGGTPMAGAPDEGVRGAGIGYGGFDPYGVS
jgi:hypothetical protein